MSINNKNNNLTLNNHDTKQRQQAARTAGEIFQEKYRRLEERKSESSPSSQGETNASQSLRSRVGKTAAEEQKVVLDWAKETNNLWFEPKDWLDGEYGESDLRGTESDVWHDSNRNLCANIVITICCLSHNNIESHGTPLS